jgi:hypothetical protein
MLGRAIAFMRYRLAQPSPALAWDAIGAAPCCRTEASQSGAQRPPFPFRNPMVKTRRFRANIGEHAVDHCAGERRMLLHANLAGPIVAVFDVTVGVLSRRGLRAANPVDDLPPRVARTKRVAITGNELAAAAIAIPLATLAFDREDGPLALQRDSVACPDEQHADRAKRNDDDAAAERGPGHRRRRASLGRTRAMRAPAPMRSRPPFMQRGARRAWIAGFYRDRLHALSDAADALRKRRKGCAVTRAALSLEKRAGSYRLPITGFPLSTCVPRCTRSADLHLATERGHCRQADPGPGSTPGSRANSDDRRP